MMKRIEFQFKGHNDTPLFAQSWQNTSSDIQANLIMTHGHGEHSEWYSRLAEAVVPKGYNFYAWDLQGHGKSSGKRGYIENFDNHCSHLINFISFLKREIQDFQKKPFFLMGHSMGGMITLKLLLNEQNIGHKATCLSSPLIDVAIAIPIYKDLAARALHKILPQFTMPSGTDPQNLSRDSIINQTYEKDPLRTHMVCPNTYLGILNSSEEIKKNTRKITTPILFQLAGDDKIVSCRSSEKIFKKISSQIKQKIVYPKAYHEVFNDICREQAYDDLHNFLQERLNS